MHPVESILGKLLLAVDMQMLTRGAAIAIVGLLIVFTALVLISLFIAWLPLILERLAAVWPEVADHHAAHHPADELGTDEGAALAAIGFVLHTEWQRQIAQDSTASSRPRN